MHHFILPLGFFHSPNQPFHIVIQKWLLKLLTLGTSIGPCMQTFTLNIIEIYATVD